MKLRIINAIVAVVFCLSLVLAPAAFGESTRAAIMKTASGSAQQITTDTTIYTRKFSVQSKVGNTATCYVGLSTVSATVHFYSLSPGAACTFTVSEYEATRGQQFQLSDFWVLGTNPDLIVINYEVTTS